MYCRFKRKTGAQVIFLNPFTIAHRATDACRFLLFMNGSYPFANGLNGLVHLCIFSSDECTTNYLAVA